MPKVAYSKWIRPSTADDSSPRPGLLRFGPMRLRDVDSVARIERESFPTPYTADIFREELAFRESSWWVVHQFTKRSRRPVAQVVAYVGYFTHGEGAHVAKIATHPQWRRRGLGEWTLLNMLLAADKEGVSYVSLEVRESNTAAQSLYLKWGFVQLERIIGYYEDTGEDGRIFLFAGLGADDVRAWLLDELQRVTVSLPRPV
ncbi:ribosomal protein S18-alanine N-acetyltransferase [Streptomyces sp. SD15]